MLASWLPKFEPPVGGNDFITPYDERLKVALTVEDTETLASVFGRAIDELQPQVAADSLSHPDDLLSVVYWIWFYMPADDGGLARAYERPSDLILIDKDGWARWNVPMAEMPYGDIVRAGQHGLLRGDPLRPYLALLQPQGGGDLQIAWEAAQTVWQALEVLLTATGAVALGAEARNRLRARLRGRRVAMAASEQWAARGGGPHRIRATIDRKPWTPDDLRIVMNLPTPADAVELLSLFGYDPTPGGLYEMSEADEVRLLRLVEDEVFDDVARGVQPDSAVLQERLKRLVESGELPDYDPGEWP